MRPASIVNFERVVIVIILLSIASAALEWSRTVAQLARQGVGEGVVIGVVGAMLALLLLLMWLIARRRSNIARWLYVALIVAMLAASLPSVLRTLEGDLTMMLLNLLYVALALVSIWLLFRADARAWFAGGDTPAD